MVDEEIKKFDLIPLYLRKLSWNFSKKEKCNDIIKKWHITFKLSDFKERNFLHLLNNDLSETKPSYMKGGSWIKHFGFSNLLYAYTTRAITNHALIGEYCLRFFYREEFKCSCRFYSIKLKYHILYEYRWFNKYWNLMREMMNQFISFLEFNPNAFSFRENIIWASCYFT